jgi:hypothetical protein
VTPPGVSLLFEVLPTAHVFSDLLLQNGDIHAERLFKPDAV